MVPAWSKGAAHSHTDQEFWRLLGFGYYARIHIHHGETKIRYFRLVHHNIRRMSAKMETKVTRINGRWVLQFRAEIMTTPAFWHYNTEQEATAAEKRLNPSIHSCTGARLLA